jgi:hypothetical protein
MEWLKTIVDDPLYYTLALVYVCVMAFTVSFLIAYTLV